MATGFVYSDRFLEHDTGDAHPERPDRLRAVTKRLHASGLWGQLSHLPFEPATVEQAAAVHDEAYLARVKRACERHAAYVDSVDSAIAPVSYEIALLAAGGAIAAVDAVMKGTVRNAFAALRPPGHHAERDRSMGFCLINNVAVAAEHLARTHGLQRVAIIDIDVHHGNGTQHIFEERSDVLFVSLHEHPMYLYPGSGFAHDVGRGAGTGFTLNVPLDPNADDARYRHVFQTMVLPLLEGFDPQFVLVSAGFDATPDDPLAHLNLTPQGYQWLARQLVSLAEKHCGGRIVSVLEGGYDLRSLAECVELHLRTLCEHEVEDDHMAMKAGF